MNLKRPRKARSSTGRASRRVVYRQGGRRATVEKLDLLAIRWNEGHREDVRRALLSFGQIKEFRSQRILVLHPRDRRALGSAPGRLEDLQASGAVEFVTPVLRDPDSDTQQILTDEITVRFRSDKPASEVKNVLKKHGLRLVRRNEFRPNQYVVSVPDPNGLKTLEAAGELDAFDDVEFAAPNFISEIKR